MSHAASSFPFKTEDVLRLLGYSVPCNRTSFYIQCPFCRSKGKPLNIELTSSFYRCNKNPDHHGNILTFYKELTDAVDNKTAYKEIMEKLNIKDFSDTPKPVIPESNGNEYEIDFMKTDKVNRKILAKSSLSKKNKEDLLKRGFSEEDISRIGYKTMPERDGKQIYEFVKSLNVDDPSGVPGFFISKKGSWVLRHGKRGIIVPYHSFYNKIHGIQIRKDNDVRELDENGKMEHKYYYLSSRYMNGGTEAQQISHYAGKFVKDESGIEKLQITNGTLVLIEGGMKADLFYCLTGQTCMAIPGVNAIKLLEKELPILKENGVHTILIGYDMDRLMKIEVLIALHKLRELIVSFGIECKNLAWSTSYLEVSGEKKTLNVDKTFVFTPESYLDAVERNVLEKTLEQVKKCGITQIMFAMKNKEDASNENFERFSALQKVCDAYNFIEVKPIFWDLKLKGIDDFYAYKLKGILP